MSPQKASSITGRRLSLLLKSPYGFGKTIAACTMAIDGPVYLAYFDKSEPIELLKFFKKYRPDLLDNIEFDVFGAHNAHMYLNKLFELKKECRYIGVITDSATMLTAAAVNWSMGFRDPKGPEKDSINKEAPQLIPDFDEYKVETSLVTQALDICKALPCHNIWTCHPVPSIKLEGTGASMRVTRVTNIVSYGSKVAGIIPGQFQEIYHFAKGIDYSTNPSRTKYTVLTDMVGDDFAKTALDLPKEIDITDKLFWEVMKPLFKANGVGGY